MDTIKRQAEQILARPEFRRVREKRVRPRDPSSRKSSSDSSPRKEQPHPEKNTPEPEPAARDTAPSWLSSLFSAIASGLSQILLFGAYAIVAAVALAILWFLVQRFRQSRSEAVKSDENFEEGDLGAAPGEIAADEYLRRAAELARQGNYREAIAQLVLGAKSHAERQGLIRFRRGLTHRDYLRALQPRSQQQSAFRTLVGVYEPICFGRRPASSELYEASVSDYSGGFGHV